MMLTRSLKLPPVQCGFGWVAGATPSISPAPEALFSSAAAAADASAAASGESSVSVSVAIAGGGPTGLTTAMLLSKYGVPCILLERSPTLTTHPRAHFINHRTMEIFRGLDGLADEVTTRMPPLSEWRSFVYCSTLTGHVLGSVDHFHKGRRSSMDPYGLSPEPVAHLAQDKLLPLMARRAGASPGVDLRMGHRVVEVIQKDSNNAEASEERGGKSGAGAGGVRLRIERADDSTQYHIDAHYLVAADGAHSHIRRALGIPMLGPGAIQHLINIHFSSPSLGATLKNLKREGMLYFVFGQRAIAVMVAHDISAGEFVAQVPYFPPLQSPKDFTPEICADIVRKAAGDAALPLHVKTVRPWAMSADVAEQYRSGNILLAGDAAHVVPPSGALGMNTGIQDAHNLAWKLAAVVRGKAPSQLLDTYGIERRPVAESNMRLSVANFRETLRVAKVMGLDYEVANAASGALSSTALGWVSEGLRRGVLDVAIAAGKAASGPMSALRSNELESLFEKGQTLRLQYPKEDLGFVYGLGGSVSWQEGDRELIARYCGPKPRAAPYVPVLLPGARLPHFNLRIMAPGKLNISKEKTKPAAGMVSSLDLMPAAGLRFVLLLATTHHHQPGSTLRAWMEAVRRYNATPRGERPEICPVIVVESPCQEGEIEAALLQADSNVAVVEDVDGSYGQLCLDDGMLRGGNVEKKGSVVLVRPDGHVAWRGAVFGDDAAAKERFISNLILRDILKW